MTKKNNNKDNNNNNNKKMTVKKKKLGKLAMTDQTIRELETCIEVRKKKRKSAQTKMRREREPPKTKLEKQRDEDEDEVVLVVFVSRGFFLSFFLCVSDSVAACIFFLRLIRFRARFSRSLFI